MSATARKWGRVSMVRSSKDGAGKGVRRKHQAPARILDSFEYLDRREIQIKGDSNRRKFSEMACLLTPLKTEDESSHAFRVAAKILGTTKLQAEEEEGMG